MTDGPRLELDKERVTVLLLINSLLIKKAHDIYVTILSNRAAIQQMPPQSRQGILEQYNNINRRLQCNLGVLAYLDSFYDTKSMTQSSQGIEFPVILSPPPEMPELRSLYKRLQDLYPEAIEFLRIKMQQIKSQQESQVKPPQVTQTPQDKQGAHMPLQQQQTISRMNHSRPQIDPRASHQQDPSQSQQRQQTSQQQFTPFIAGQSDVPPQYHSPQINIAQTQFNGGQVRRHDPATIASKIPVQHHLPHHHSKHLEMSVPGGISPQMMSKDTDFSSFNEAPSLLDTNVNKNAPNLSSISPQQILQQQIPQNDLSMDFF